MRKPAPGSWRKSNSDLPGVERQADLADEALAAGQVGGRDDGPLRSRAEVVDVDAVLRQEPVGTGAVVDVRVVVIRRVGLAFDEHDLLEAQLLRIDGRFDQDRAARGRCRPPGPPPRPGPRPGRRPASRSSRNRTAPKPTNGVLVAVRISYPILQESASCSRRAATLCCAGSPDRRQTRPPGLKRPGDLRWRFRRGPETCTSGPRDRVRPFRLPSL